MSESTPALRLSGITKSFGSNEVLSGVTMDLEAGQITALLGANGAGKSTLIKILSGAYFRDGGTIEIGGEEVQIDSPKDAAAHGLQTVHQRIDDSIVPGLTVAENLLFEEVVSGQVPRVSSINQMLPRARKVAEALDLDWPDSKLRTDVFEQGIADNQLLLLARALVHRPKVLILDEPTSTLSKSEAARLFDVIRRLRDDGVAILYVSHHLSEIRLLADTLVVLRDGKITDWQERPLDLERAVTAMLGSEVATEAEGVDERRGTETAISVENLTLLPRSEPIELELRYGEVTGVVGLLGAGKSELVRTIFGARKAKGAQMKLDGKPYQPRGTSDAVASHVYLVAENRATEAMFPGWSIARTVSLPFMGLLSKLGVIDFRKEKSRAANLIDSFDVVSTGPYQPVDALSGGNQQKVVVGRWMQDNPKVLLLDEPFRGVDIGARHDIAAKTRATAAAGTCVVVCSSDIDEIRAVADRIIVVVEGQIVLDAYTTQVENEQLIKSMSEVA